MGLGVIGLRREIARVILDRIMQQTAELGGYGFGAADPLGQRCTSRLDTRVR
jgi:hypothetical protein